MTNSTNSSERHLKLLSAISALNADELEVLILSSSTFILERVSYPPKHFTAHERQRMQLLAAKFDLLVQTVNTTSPHLNDEGITYEQWIKQWGIS